MPLAAVVKVGKELAEAVRQLHSEARLAHFDLKPANILVDDALHLFLCDFSIALEFPEGQTNISLPQDNYGSLHYMAPEQVCRLPCCAPRVANTPGGTPL